MADRNLLYNHLCGDIWRLADGRCFVVDYVGSLRVGLTFGDGGRAGFNYRNDMARWIVAEGGNPVSAFEDAPLLWNCDARGWTQDYNAKFPTAEQSVAFLKERIGDGRRKG